MRTLCHLAGTFASLWLWTLAVAADQPRNVHRIQIVGNKTIPTSKIKDCLAQAGDVLAAAQRTHSDQAFTQAIQATLREGYKNAGFHQSEFVISLVDGVWTASIDEGPRILKDAIQVDGIPATGAWLKKAIEEYQNDPAKYIWTEGYAWNGEMSLTGDPQKHLDECLQSLGINPRYVTRSIKVERSTTSNTSTAVLVLYLPEAVKPTRIENLKCTATDQQLILSILADHGMVLGAQADTGTSARAEQILLASYKFDSVKARLEPGHGLGDMVLNVQGTRSDSENAEAIAARQKVMDFGRSLQGWLASGRGLRLTMGFAEKRTQVWMFEKTIAMELAKADRIVARLFNNSTTDKVAIETGDGTRYAFGMPNFATRLSFTEPEEKHKKWAFKFDGNFKTNANIDIANRFELNSYTLCTLFPLTESKCTQGKDGCVITSSDARLQLAENGDFQSLSIKSEEHPQDIWLLESVERMPDHIRKVEATERDQLAFIVPETQPSSPDSEKNAFYVRRHQRDFTAQWLFLLVHEGLKYEPDTAIYSLAELHSISTTGDAAALHEASQRWLASQAHGPFTTMAVAYFYANVRDGQRAADYAAEAMQLLTDKASLRSDLDRVFASGCMLGNAAGQLNAGELHKLVSQIVVMVSADESVANVLRLTEPPATDSVEQWKVVVERLIPLGLAAPMQSLAGQLSAGSARTAARP